MIVLIFYSRRRVGLILWHPTAANILVSSGHDHLVIVWNIVTATPVNIIDSHTDTVFSMSFNLTGSLLATTCKDKMLRILDPRSGEVVQQGRSHEGTKAAKVEYLGDSGQLVTTGFSKFSDRQLAVWSQDDLTAPLKMENIDCSSGVLNPVYDHDTRMVYVWGKGDGNIRYYEVSSEAPWVSFLSQVISGEPQRGFGVMPKHGVDAGSCELFRFYKLHATKDMVEPISMIVPRKSNMFQQDVFPDTAAPVPALSQDEWIQGEDAAPVMMSMRPGSTLPLIQKKTDWSRVMGDKNNDKKYHFLSKETQPDYRQIHQTSKNSNNNNKDTDNSQYYSSNRNRKVKICVLNKVK